jgi:hypothetical protein
MNANGGNVWRWRNADGGCLACTALEIFIAIKAKLQRCMPLRR